MESGVSVMCVPHINKQSISSLFLSCVDSPSGSSLLVALGGHQDLFLRVLLNFSMAQPMVAALTRSPRRLPI
jgi:hypothetical protein